MSAIIKAARADAQRLLRYVREATTIDAERKLAAALLVKRDGGFRAAARRDRKWRLTGSQQESDRCVRQTRTKEARLSAFPSVNQFVRLPVDQHCCRTARRWSLNLGFTDTFPSVHKTMI